MKQSTLLALTLSFVASSASCADFIRQAQNVAITSVPHKVAGCKLLGQVQDDSASGGFRDGLLELQKQTVMIKGNTLLMMSATSNFGTAYSCSPPIKGDSEG